MISDMERAIAEDRPATAFHRGTESGYEKLVADARAAIDDMHCFTFALAAAHDLVVARHVAQEPR